MISINREAAFYFEELIWSFNQLVYCTLAIITIVMVGTFPLLNALFVWEIMYSIEVLRKHAQNKWQMGC
jgi:hypothetical protein